MSDVIWRERPKLRAPVMVCAFRGWNDAGEAATAALSYIRGSFEAREVAAIDPEDFYDFTAVRPSVKIAEGSMRDIEWPENSFSVAPVPGAEGDLVLLQGVEPSLRWRRFTEDVTTARDLGVKMVITLGALLADVPHSRPVAISGITRTRRSSSGSASSRPGTRAPRGSSGSSSSVPEAGLLGGEPVGVGAALRGGLAEPQGGARPRARVRGHRGTRRGRRRARGARRRITSGR